MWYKFQKARVQRYCLGPNSDLSFVHAAKLINGMAEVSLILNTLQYLCPKPEYSKEKEREGKLRYKHAEAKISQFHCQTNLRLQKWLGDWALVHFFKQENPLLFHFLGYCVFF